MAYVPPHRRVQASSSSHTPKIYYFPEGYIDVGPTVRIWFAVDANVNPPPPNLQLEFKPFADTSIPHLRDKKLYTISVHSHPVEASSSSENPPRFVKRLYYYIEADVDEGSNVRIWFAVDANANPPANLKLEFKPFADTSIPHLQDKKVYTISVKSHPVDDVENDMRSLMNNESPPWRYTLEKIKDDLRKCFNKLENYVKMSEPYYAKPSFIARFGKIIFHRYGFAWHESLTLDILEKIFSRSSRTFDNNIPKDIFDAVKEKVIMSLASPKLKEKVAYLILVEDVLNPDVGMVVTCRKKDIDGKQIELKKIELLTLRHFHADTSCLTKLMDWRLSVTEKYMIDLHEEDKECIEGIVKSACIDVSAKGGLFWPPGGLKRNRFHVKGVWILNVTTIVGKTWDIKFQHANRVHFEDSSACRVSNEIDLKLKSISKYLRERRQWEDENIMNILEDSLKWFWMEGLSII